MYTEQRDSMMKETLKSICCSNGWSYGIFWGFDQRNSLLLTLKDAYYEEQMGALIDNMLLQVHVLGGRVIGQAAFAKNHRWIHSDVYHDIRQKSLATFENLELFQDDSDFYWQFCMGIKTIAIISVEPWGVAQLGSTDTIPETKEFVDQVKHLFGGICKGHNLELSDNEHSSSAAFQLSADSEGFLNDSNLFIPSQLEEMLLDSGNLFDYDSDCSVLTSYWPPLPNNSFHTLLSNDQLKSENLPTNSMQSCVTRPCEENLQSSSTLFSQLGIDGLLDGTASSSICSFPKSRFEDQSPSSSSYVAKRRKIDDNCSWCNNQVENRDILTRTGKKRAKAGTKPRPKDRQMIQDRLAELRELIPNGQKMSIDRLLERTIRHLSFMSSLTQHAQSMKQIDNKKSNNGDGGVTWACEVVDQAMVCPLIVKDLSTSNQMLIKITCEEQGFFLEIVDIIREFGLIIFKGVMEARETKIWAHFIVESKGNPRVTRHEIFSSLIQLLQMRGGVAADSTNDCFGNIKISSSNASLFNNCQYPDVLTDAVEFASL